MIGFGSEEEYLARRPDVAELVKSGVIADGLSHYNQYGAAEDFKESGGRGFGSEELYLARRPDVAALVKDGTLPNGKSHYDQYGAIEDLMALGMSQDEAVQTLVNEQIASQKGDDFGSLAEAPYRAFTPYSGEAPTYTPLGDFKLSDYFEDPGYKFRLSEGEKAINRAQAARGGFYSGAALKEAERFSQDLASQEFANTYGRYVDKYNRNVNDFNIATGEYSKRRGEHNEDFGIGYNQAARDSDTLYNRIAGITNAGQGATNTAVAANTQNANAIGNIAGQSANAAAAATLNQGNQISSAVQSIANTFGQSGYGGNQNRLPWQAPGNVNPAGGYY